MLLGATAATAPPAVSCGLLTIVPELQRSPPTLSSSGLHVLPPSLRKSAFSKLRCLVLPTTSRGQIYHRERLARARERFECRVGERESGQLKLGREIRVWRGREREYGDREDYEREEWARGIYLPIYTIRILNN